MNVFRTGLLAAALTGLFLCAGFLIGGGPGVLIAFCFAAMTNLWAYWNSDKALLSIYGARQVDRSDAPDLVYLVSKLAAKAGLPMPRVFIVEDPQPNAFATGRDPQHAAICVTSGLLGLSNEELAGVVAHELGHVKHGDTLTTTITATVAGAISMLANFSWSLGGDRRNNPVGIAGMLLVMLLAPVSAMLAQMAVSRSREFEADRAAAEISGRPLWLASALAHIGYAAKAIDNEEAEQHPATAHMFIVNALRGRMSGLFASHPSTEERIARLRAMAGSAAGMPWA